MQRDLNILYIIFVVLFSHLLPTKAQGIQDSIFEIKHINVFGQEKIFDTPEAGLKKSKLDTLILKSNKGQSLASLLANNTPVFIKTHGRGALATASLRGTAASHTKVNWNGININSPMLGMVDFSQIPVFLIDDISLKYGNSSLSEQGGGLGGTINLNNLPNWSNTFSGQYYQSIGSYDSYDEMLAISTGNKHFQSKSRLYHIYSKNDYTFYNKSIAEINYTTGELSYPLDTNKNAAYTLYGFQQELYWRANANNFISLKYWGQNSERSIPRVFSHEGPQNSNKNRQNTLHHNLVADWKTYTDHSQINVLSGLIYKTMRYEQLYLVSSQGLKHSVFSESTQKSWFNTVKYDYTSSNQYFFNASINANLHAVNTKDSVSHIGYNKYQSEVSIYASLQKQYVEKLNINLMLRQDLIDGKRIPLMPLLGFDYALDSNHRHVLKGNISRNYHSPSLNDKYWQPGGNPNLKAEEGYSSELELAFQRTINTWQLKGSVGAYYSKIDNWILWLPNVKGYWEPINLRTVESKGIEINVKIHKTLGENTTITLLGNYAYSPTLNKDEAAKATNSYNKQLVYIPKHAGDLLARFTWKTWYFNWEYSSYGTRYTTTSNDANSRQHFNPYFMNDVALGRTWQMAKFTINTELKSYNFFNESYRSAIYHPMPKRNYKLQLTFTF